MSIKKNKITIIGGGPAGLASAYYAKKNGIEFIVYEASDSFGGNCQTIKYNNFFFDTGAHRLHDKDHETTKLFKDLLKERLRKTYPRMLNDTLPTATISCFGQKHFDASFSNKFKFS